MLFSLLIPYWVQEDGDFYLGLASVYAPATAWPSVWLVRLSLNSKGCVAEADPGPCVACTRSCQLVWVWLSGVGRCLDHPALVSPVNHLLLTSDILNQVRPPPSRQ